MSESPWMTLEETCAYAKRSRETVRRAAVLWSRKKTEGLRAHQRKAHARWRFHVEDVDRWIRGEPPRRTTRQ